MEAAEQIIDLTLTSPPPESFLEPPKQEEDKPQPQLLFSLDPGTTNMGSMLSGYWFDPKEKELHWWIFKDTMRTTKVCEQTINMNAIPLIHCYLLKQLEPFLGHFHITALVEHQYFNPQKREWWVALQLNKLNVILLSLLRCALQLNSVQEVFPNIYKPRLGIATKSHGGNKEAAIEFAHDIAQRYDPEIRMNNHVADCFNESYDWLKKTFGKETPLKCYFIETKDIIPPNQGKYCA